jgi:hypothetical protein
MTGGVIINPAHLLRGTDGDLRNKNLDVKKIVN